VDPPETLPALQWYGPPVQCLPTGGDRIDGDRSSTRSGDGRGSSY